MFDSEWTCVVNVCVGEWTNGSTARVLVNGHMEWTCGRSVCFFEMTFGGFVVVGEWPY